MRVFIRSSAAFRTACPLWLIRFLFRRGKLGRGAAPVWQMEDRVVAEAVAALGFVLDNALNGTLPRFRPDRRAKRGL